MSKKKEDLEALRDALLIRKKVTNVLRVLALQSQKRLDLLEDALAKATTEESRVQVQEAMREERFNARLIKEECRTLAVKSADLTGSLRTANTIFPDTELPYVLAEATERRIWMDRALGACNVIQNELQYIAEEVYSDKNKFTALTLELKALFNKIRALRQADNRFWRQSKDVISKG